MIKSNNLDINKALNIYEKYPVLINNIIDNSGKISDKDLLEFTKAFGSNFIVCLLDHTDGFRILITLQQFELLIKTKTSSNKNNIDLILCDTDFEIIRESVCLYKIFNFL